MSGSVERSSSIIESEYAASKTDVLLGVIHPVMNNTQTSKHEKKNDLVSSTDVNVKKPIGKIPGEGQVLNESIETKISITEAEYISDTTDIFPNNLKLITGLCYKSTMNLSKQNIGGKCCSWARQYHLKCLFQTSDIYSDFKCNVCNNQNVSIKK